MIVMKFGGSCLDTPDDIRRMVEIVRSEQKRDPKIVLSALKGITDQLVAQANSAQNGKFDIEPIEHKHRQILDDLPGPIRMPLEAVTAELLEELRGTLAAVGYLKELTPSTKDKIVTFGERLVIHVTSGYMTEAALTSQPLSGNEAGILTNSHFGNATILGKSLDLVREKISATHNPLIAGYFGQDDAGRIASLGRGATDYIASHIASALECECILYKDVPGIMTADPKVVRNARLVEKIDYLRAIELARYGSKVLFEKAIYPAMKGTLPIRLTSFRDPGRGTIVSAEGSAQVVASMKGVVMIRVGEIPGLSSIASILEPPELSDSEGLVIAVQGSRSEILLVTVDSFTDTVVERARHIGSDVKVEIAKGLGLVAMVGGRLGIPETYNLLEKAKIRSHSVLRVSPERSILVFVDLKDVEQTVGVLHDSIVSG